MAKTNFTQKQKLAVLKGAKKTTVRYAAKVAGIHYTTLRNIEQLHPTQRVHKQPFKLLILFIHYPVNIIIRFQVVGIGGRSGFPSIMMVDD